MFNVSRYCTTNPSNSLKTLSYNIRGSIWSTTSIQTKLSQLSFTLTVDGSVVGTASQGDNSFGPGQGVPFNLTVTHITVGPSIPPATSNLILTLSTVVAAGLYSATETTSDSTTQNFPSAFC
jgi:hypothetical protein